MISTSLKLVVFQHWKRPMSDLRPPFCVDQLAHGSACSDLNIDLAGDIPVLWPTVFFLCPGPPPNGIPLFMARWLRTAASMIVQILRRNLEKMKAHRGAPHITWVLGTVGPTCWILFVYRVILYCWVLTIQQLLVYRVILRLYFIVGFQPFWHGLHG